MKVSCIVPVLDREERLTEVLEQLRSVLHDIPHETIIVWDVTRLEWLPEIRQEQRELEARYGVRVLTRTDERGFGSALRTGARVAEGDVIVPIMADCSDDLATIPAMLTKIEEGADIVAGSRYIAGGGIVGDTFKQRTSRLYSWLLHLVTGAPCHDFSNSFKAYRRRVWEEIETEADSFDISAEITVKALVRGLKVAEVPSVWTNRKLGQSHFRMGREALNYGRWAVYATLRRPRPLSKKAMVLALGGLIAFFLARVTRRHDKTREGRR